MKSSTQRDDIGYDERQLHSSGKKSSKMRLSTLRPTGPYARTNSDPVLPTSENLGEGAPSARISDETEDPQDGATISSSRAVSENGDDEVKESGKAADSLPSDEPKVGLIKSPADLVVDDDRLSPRVGILRAGFETIDSGGGARSPKQCSRGSSLDRRPFSLWTFVAFEAFGERHSTGLDDSVPQAIDNFLAVPARFERFMALGLLVSLDTFLDAVTFLPLRATVAAVALLARGLRRILAWRNSVSSGSRSRFGSGQVAKSGNPKARRSFAKGSFSISALLAKGPNFNRARAYDLMRFATVLLGKEALMLVPMSRTYHWIRGQNTIKLYVIVGIMEVLDRLACAFGQDALDSFYLTTRRYETLRDSKRVLLFLIVVNGVVLLHTGLLYVHITTLNVVVNASEDSAIIALLVSNNFSEIKSFVFKRYNARNLFDVACSDVCERFKLCLFLSLLALLAWSQAVGTTDPARRREGMTTVMSQASVIMVFEIIADWVKHAFMAKFNKLDAAVYDEFADRLARDVVTGRGGGLALDHTHAVTRRLGLAVLPLACVSARYLSIAASWLRLSLQLSNTALALVLAAFALCIFELKMLTSICLAGVAVGQHRQYLESKAGGEYGDSVLGRCSPGCTMTTGRATRSTIDDQSLLHKEKLLRSCDTSKLNQRTSVVNLKLDNLTGTLSRKSDCTDINSEYSPPQVPSGVNQKHFPFPPSLDADESKPKSILAPSSASSASNDNETQLRKRK